VFVDAEEWRRRFANFKAGGGKEIILRENFGRDGADVIHELASEAGLYSKARCPATRAPPTPTPTPTPTPPPARAPPSSFPTKSLHRATAAGAGA
jgi:hypothetical protein